VDKRLYLDVNRLATRTSWAHGLEAFLARPAALLMLVVLVMIALVRALSARFGGNDPDQMAAVAWTAIAAGVAYLVSVPLSHLVGRVPPFVALPQAVVLISRPGGFSFPNGHAVLAGAVATGLWTSRARLTAALATLAALLISFAVVYTGTAYPGDAVAGLLLGAFVTLALYPVAIGLLRELACSIARSPLKSLGGPGHSPRPIGSGPAARPEPIGESGTVRILPPGEVSARAGTRPEPS
jgi:membrane-associated phospholipid phosphatase